jgi:hypothetical protein
MYAIRMSVDNYINFAQWIVGRDPSHGNERRYRLGKNPLEGLIETKLQDLSAQVYTDCDGSGSKFDKSQDKIKTERDKQKRLNVSIPVEICEKANGDIDIKYLEDYVKDLKLKPDADGAWALLGMYFLSRCK